MAQKAEWRALQNRAIGLVMDKCVSPEGWFYASDAQNPEFGNFQCLFGRDSAWMSIFSLYYVKKTGQAELLAPVKRTLEKLADTQGRQKNVHSGELPGKIIHELRTHNHEFLTMFNDPNWHIYPDGVMRIYMSADSTFLFLLAVWLYWQVSKNDRWMEELQYPVKSALHYALFYGDADRDGLQDYTFNARPYGGLPSQGWMDSGDFHEGRARYPIALAEVQAYAYLAFLLWSEFFASRDQKISERLAKAMKKMKNAFGHKFPTLGSKGIVICPSIDNLGHLSSRIRSSMGHCLFSVEAERKPNRLIVDSTLASGIRTRLMQEDMFCPEAGIRTLSRDDPDFDGQSYHNGSIWPHDNMIIALGFRHHGFEDDASEIEKAILKTARHFDSPGVELFHYDPQTEQYRLYRDSQTGQTSNLTQGWSLLATALAAAYQCR